MKTSKFIFTFFITTITLFYACKPANQKDLIVGRWKMIDWVASPKMPNTDPGLKDQLIGATLVFRADSSFNITLVSDSVVGTYRVHKDGKTVSFQPEGMSPFVDSIQELTKTSLILIDPIGNKIIATNEID